MMRNRQTIGRLVVVAVLGFAAIASTAAQSTPVVDGIVGAQEYAVEHVDGPVHLYARLGAETLYLAIVGEAEGYVAIGVGSKQMDGATIFTGYAGKGKESFAVQKGVHHNAHDFDAKGVLGHAMSRSGSSMTMELALDRRATYLGAGRTSLDVIYAVGHYDSFIIYHAFRGATRLELR